MNQSALTAVRPALPRLLVTLAGALVAGVPYGLVAEQLGGSVSFIGLYYGAQDPVVGWLTHEFHSIVFAFVYAGLVSLIPVCYRDRLWAYVVVGVAWGAVLWVGAAGIISPVWLRLVGISASIPTLSGMLFWAHLAWGISLSLVTAVSYRYLVPRMTERTDG